MKGQNIFSITVLLKECCCLPLQWVCVRVTTVAAGYQSYVQGPPLHHCQILSEKQQLLQFVEKYFKVFYLLSI